jgi:hypothetical protein
MEMRRPVVLLAGLLLLALGGAFLALMLRGPPKQELSLPSSVDIPSDGEVAGIAVRLYNSCQQEPDEPEFDLPAEFVPEVLAVFRPVRVARHHPAVEEYGTMRLRLRGGGDVELRLYRLNKEPVLFSVSGVPCTRGGPYKDMAPGYHKYYPESFALEGLLREFALITKGRGSHDRVREVLEKFARSAGRGEHLR